MDLLATIGMELDEEDIERIQDMSLEHYLVARLEAGRREQATVSQQGLQEGTIQAGVAAPAGRARGVSRLARASWIFSRPGRSWARRCNCRWWP